MNFIEDSRGSLTPCSERRDKRFGDVPERPEIALSVDSINK
jgi:hypothetical protein